MEKYNLVKKRELNIHKNKLKFQILVEFYNTRRPALFTGSVQKSVDFIRILN